MAPYAAHVRQLLRRGDRAIVPALWQMEIANGFVIAERRGMLTSSETSQIWQSFEVVVDSWIEIKRESVSIRRLIGTAREFRLTAYDAAYLDLARAQQLSIATLDRGLAAAAKVAGVALLN